MKKITNQLGIIFMGYDHSQRGVNLYWREGCAQNLNETEIKKSIMIEMEKINRKVFMQNIELYSVSKIKSANDIYVIITKYKPTFDSQKREAYTALSLICKNMNINSAETILNIEYLANAFYGNFSKRLDAKNEYQENNDLKKFNSYLPLITIKDSKEINADNINIDNSKNNGLIYFQNQEQLKNFIDLSVELPHKRIFFTDNNIFKLEYMSEINLDEMSTINYNLNKEIDTEFEKSQNELNLLKKEIYQLKELLGIEINTVKVILSKIKILNTFESSIDHIDEKMIKNLSDKIDEIDIKYQIKISALNLFVEKYADKNISSTSVEKPYFKNKSINLINLILFILFLIFGIIILQSIVPE